MQFEKAEAADYSGILTLQANNQIKNLTAEEKSHGFLSVEFSKEQFIAMNNSTWIIVCKDKGIVCGYLCTSPPEFNKAFPLPAAMIALYPKINYKGKTLDSYHSITAGPWCIERSYHGKGIFVSMWNMLDKILSSDIDLIVTFISIQNTRSFYAAKKVGMEEVTTFKFGEDEFYILAAQRTKPSK